MDLKNYYQLQECVNPNYVDATETEDIPQIVISNEDCEAPPPPTEACETRSKS